MPQGKFSNPRPHRDEERQIEQAFRQLTGQEPVKKNEPQIFGEPIPEELPPDFDENFETQLEAEIEKALETPAAPVRGAYERPAPAAPRKSAESAATRIYRQEQPYYEEEQEAPEEDFLDKAMSFINENKKLMLAFLCAAALLMIVMVTAVFFFGGRSAGNETIFSNIYIADIYVGGLTKNEAVSEVKQATSRTYGVEDMVIDLSGTELRLSPEDTGAELDVKAAVEAAYAYGRTGTEEEQERAQQNLLTQPYTIALLPYLELDTDYILDTLTDYAEDAGSTLTQTSYGLEGNQPPLNAEDFDENAPTQTLVITMGTPGIGFDAQDVYDQVLDAYSLHTFLVTVEDVESAKEPDPIDLEAIYEEFYIEPKNATVNMQTFETIPGSYGYGFDREAAQKKVENAAFGEEIRIPMEYIEPEILDEDMFFRDELGSAHLSYSSSKNRNTNLQLACDAINGTVLNPGETFSFNDTVGQRSSGKGYKSALENLNDEEENEIVGGGVGQVASALYQCALLSDLEINYRVNQDFAPDYTDAGLEAAVDWRSPDFQFTNSTGFPIRIEAAASNGNVSIQILGTDERQYYVDVETVTTATDKPDTRYEDFEFDNEEGYEDGDVIREGITGFTVKTYLYKYDKSTGELLSKDFVSTSQYETVDEIIARVEPEETTEPETEPPTEPPTRPTEAPTKPTAPPTVPTEPETQPAETQPIETQPVETEPKMETEPEVIPGTEPKQADAETEPEASDTSF